MIYLFLQSLAPTIPASFLTFGHTPLYPVYATFPRIWGVSALNDQLIAGLIMKLVGGLLLWGVIAVIFFRWFEQEQRDGLDRSAYQDVQREIGAELGTMSRATTSDRRGAIAPMSDGKNRQSLLLPILIPVGALAVIALVLVGFSRVLLAVSHNAATVVALVAAAGIVGVAAWVASRKRVTGADPVLDGGRRDRRRDGGGRARGGRRAAAGGSPKSPERGVVVALAAPEGAAAAGLLDRRALGAERRAVHDRLRQRRPCGGRTTS